MNNKPCYVRGNYLAGRDKLSPITKKDKSSIKNGFNFCLLKFSLYKSLSNECAFWLAGSPVSLNKNLNRKQLIPLIGLPENSSLAFGHLLAALDRLQFVLVDGHLVLFYAVLYAFRWWLELVVVVLFVQIKSIGVKVDQNVENSANHEKTERRRVKIYP